MHETTVTLSYTSADRANRIASALQPEIGDIDSDRSAVAVSRAGSDIELVVQATDPVALRAGQNTWLGLVGVAEAVTRAGRRFEDSGGP